MTTDDLIRHREGKWSTAEVLEHLYLSYTGTTKGCERCLQAGRPPSRAPRLKDRLGTAVVRGAGYFPRGGGGPKNTPPRGMAAGGGLGGIGPQDAGQEGLTRPWGERY